MGVVGNAYAVQLTVNFDAAQPKPLSCNNENACFLLVSAYWYRLGCSIFLVRSESLASLPREHTSFAAFFEVHL